MGKKKIEDFPGCGPFCSICIIPFHAGRGDFNGQEIFQRRSRLEVSSSDEMSGSPLNAIMQPLTGKIYALTSFFSQSDSVFLVKKILFADDADLFRMPLRMRNNDTMNV